MILVTYLAEPLQFQNQVSEMDLHNLIGVYSVHAMTIDSKGSLGKALFPIFSLINHDCIGNRCGGQPVTGQ